MSNGWAQFMVFLTGLLSVAIVALILSKNSQTPAVLSGFFGGISQTIGAAVSPVTGGGGRAFGNVGVQGLGLGGLGIG